jgi:hypothetical protein
MLIGVYPLSWAWHRAWLDSLVASISVYEYEKNYQEKNKWEYSKRIIKKTENSPTCINEKSMYVDKCSIKAANRCERQNQNVHLM